MERILTIVLGVMVVALSVALFFSLRSDSTTATTDKSVKEPVAIKNLSCEDSKKVLSDVYTDPDRTVIHDNMKVLSLDGNQLTVSNSSGISFVYNITTQTKVQKGEENGSTADIKNGESLSLKINALNEVVYASIE